MILRSTTPISVSLVIDSALAQPQYCSVAVYEDLLLGEIGDKIECENQEFVNSGTLVFGSFDLDPGRYIVVAALSFQYTCDPWYGTNYSSTPWHYLVVGGDSCTAWRNFEFDYYRQSKLEALPLGLSDAQQSYDTARISLEMYTATDTLPFEYITVVNWLDGDELFDYMVDHVQVSLGCSDHLFAVRGFQNVNGLVYSAYGATMYRDDGSDEPCYVCVSRLVALLYPDTTEAVSSTTIHELGHLIGRLTDACEEAPDSHVVGQCVMEDIAYYWGQLGLYCAHTGQHWPYSKAFCDSCVRRLEAATW